MGYYLNLSVSVCFFIAGSSILYGCSIPAEPKVGRDAAGTQSESGDANGASATDVKKSKAGVVKMSIDGPFEAVSRSKVSRFELDSGDLSLTGARWGKQDFMNSESPVVFWELPEKADYVELLRCDADASLRDKVDLTQVRIGSVSKTEESRIMQENDFWTAAVNSKKCVLITQGGVSGQNFTDNAARSGSYRYVLRSCVAPERLTDTEQLNNRNCSKQVAVTNELRNYYNARKQQEIEALEAAIKRQGMIDAQGRSFYYMSVDYNNLLAKCDKRNADAQARRIKKQALSQVLGMGVSFGSQMLLVNSPDATGAMREGSMSWSELGKHVYNNQDQISGVGTQWGQVFNQLLTSTSDFERSCNGAMELQSKMGIQTQKMSQLQEAWASDMDRAETVRKQNAQNFGGSK